jgi:putative ABC transport system permease protein
MVARTSGDPATFEASIRAAVRSVDADLPLFAVQPMTSILSSALAERRFAMTLIAVFATFALVLSAVGIYGVLAFLVEQRTAEIGVRIALGADARQVVKLVLGEGMLLAGLGIGLGLGGAAVIARLVATLLFGINPFDPVSFGGITSLLLVVAVLACYLPARRALRIDPLAALREE